MGDNGVERRQQVDDLLRKSTNDKLLRGGGAEARKLAEQAYCLSREPEALPNPWPALTSYRLAHLTMRSAEPDLHRADSLFLEASRARCLGPLPAIYRLAVIHRMSHLEPVDSGIVQQAFKAALQGIEEHSEDRGRPEPWRQARQQRPNFNLLEFATYTMGLSYDPLEGKGGEGGLEYGGGWIIVGHDPGLQSVRMTEAAALEELEARACDASVPVVFFITRTKSARVTRKPRPGSSLTDWPEFGEQQARYLANLLAGRLESNAELAQSLGVDENYLRLIKHRLAGDLSRLPGLAADSLLLDQGRGKPPVLNDNIPIVGAVEQRVLSRR